MCTVRSKIELELAVFGLGKLQDLLTLLSILESRGIAIEDVRKYIKEKGEEASRSQLRLQKLAKQGRKRWEKNTRSCPTCKKPLGVRPITTPKGKANREGYTCYWYCLEESCNFEEYTHEDFQKIYKKIMEVE